MQLRLSVGGRPDDIGQLSAIHTGTRPVLRAGPGRRASLLHGEKVQRRAHPGHAAARGADHMLATARGR